ncbi:uncharacterized protein LOC122511352 [Leptopilina heterotoma]|uniref:uncharacterized protein LOC122511352 n=1 Tax=Leptopilina heterotoma TaxID=63436 RepID=UPI001CA7F94A|nr:uncharacterized protein LOC122511352 [Leptopilina heterotoma]
MDSKVNNYRSLPPFVEGKIHGYLNLVIDEVIWTNINPGDVIVFVSWWGEENEIQFRPLDVTKISQKFEDTEKTYTIKTNFYLFEDYIKNCESLELIIKSEKTKKVLGTAHVVDLLDIFKTKPFTRYFPIVNKTQSRIGNVHVSIKLTNTENMPSKVENNQNNNEISKSVNFDMRSLNKQADGIFSHKIDYLSSLKNAKQEETIYRSILKDKRIEFIEPINKRFNFEVPEKLVDKPNAKSAKLKSALLKEALMDDSYVYDADKFLYDNYHPDVCPEREADLYQYFLGSDMNYFDEHAALETLRSTSPTPSLIEFATQSIHCCQRNKFPASETSKNTFMKHNLENNIKDDIQEVKVIKENVPSEIKSKEIVPLDYVDCLQIIVRSFTLSPAGYRRVKSSCLSREKADSGVPASATFFVHYDDIISSANQLKKKSMNERKPVKMTSRKQVDQEILFYHQGVYNISKNFAYTNSPLKFKVFHRHLNQRSPTLLGIGTMHVNDVFATKNLSMTQRVAIINKGIKVGELEVAVALGCDGIHFGKEFIDAVTSGKENIPVRESFSPLSTKNPNFKTVTGTHSNSNSGVSSASSRRIDTISNGSNSLTNNERSLSGERQKNGEDRNMEILIPNSKYDEKVLLHGLIYISEGRGLSELNSYIICRAFWKEDRAMSRICTNTKNPLYNFHQLVPLIHGSDLLERTKDNFIVTEVYSKTSTGEDNLIGIAKFPIHQLYVAYRDSHVLPYLLLSKYPVISVDGWILIKDPVTGQNKGQLLGLVALGTADQIALLEMTRGIRDSISNPSRNEETIPRPLENSPVIRESSEVEVQVTPCISSRNEECQTEFSTREHVINVESSNDSLKNQSKVLHSIVDCLAQALHVSRTNTNQASQTEKFSGPSQEEEQRIEVEPTTLDPISIILSDDSSNRSSKTNFNISTDMYRSVGVGAEFDDYSTQGLSNNFSETTTEISGILNPSSNEQMESDEELSFRAVVEIECALHLPKVEKANATVEPSTYVTFQGVSSPNERQYNSYTKTNVSPRTCNPRWEWRCDTKLAVDLLTNDEKKLIFKVWRLLEPDTCSAIDLDRDVVIGFAAIDLSVLLAGFPLVTGWFHIIDFTGKCNGQIKVSITPLESISSFGKSTSSSSQIKLPSEPCQSNNSNESSPRPKTMRLFNNDFNRIDDSKLPNAVNFNYPPFEETMPDIGIGFGDASLSLLSSSLKQKLTELDEITKRLQSRLHDVTENAFEDDFENDFEMNDQIDEPESNGALVENFRSPSKSVNPKEISTSVLPPTSNTILSMGVTTNLSMDVNTTSYQDKNPSSSSESRNLCSSSATNTMAVDSNFSDTGYSTCYNNQSTNYFLDCSNPYSANSSDREEEHPIKGTKMHVNHLLDKLASQLNVPPPIPMDTLPMKINIMDLLSNLQCNNNNYFQNGRSNHFNRSQEARRIQDNGVGHSQEPHFLSDEQIPNKTTEESSDEKTESVTNCTKQTTTNSENKNKVSNVIRQELSQEEEEGNDSVEFDELSAHLMATNVRHKDTENVFNPLLYQHLLPDVQLSPNSFSCSVTQDVQNRNTTPDGEAVQQLDNRYTETFNAAINSGLSRLRKMMEKNAFSDNNSQKQKCLFESENSEVFRSIPTSVSEDVDGNIDITVIHRPCIDDLMASNSSESVISSVSMEKFTEKQSETDDEENTLTSSETSTSTISRQAPDGGNPIEESDKREKCQMVKFYP